MTTRIVVVSMGSGNKIRIINGNRTIVDALVAAVSSVWPIANKVY